MEHFDGLCRLLQSGLPRRAEVRAAGGGGSKGVLDESPVGRLGGWGVIYGRRFKSAPVVDNRTYSTEAVANTIWRKPT